MTLFEGNLPQNDRDRERERDRKKERKSERASELLQETGHHRLNFPNRFCPFCECAQQYLLGLHQVLWTVMYGPRLSLLGGSYRFIVFRAHL